MLKLVSIVTVLVVLAGVPSPSNAGILPGTYNRNLFYLLYNFRKTSDACYYEGFDRQVELDLRDMYSGCYYKLSDSHQSLMNRHKRSMRHLMSFFDSINSNDIAGHQDFSLNTIDVNNNGTSAPFYNARVIRAIKDELLAAQRLLSCVFDKMGLSVDGSGEVDATALTAKFADDKGIPADVKGFLLQGIDACHKRGGDTNPMVWGKKYYNFFKILNFWRCQDYNKPYACVKADLVKQAGEFELSGLDGEFSDLDDNAKRYIIASTYPSLEQTGLYDG